eukprot:m.233165 g.233165  ORF g.233165 m.233165 type:complete len:626 (-) comp19003_c0_seq1:62-1939(-)
MAEADGRQFSLRARQAAAIRSMLGAAGKTRGDVAGDDAEASWKILVYDKFGQDILAPLLSLGELRELGVTLHLLVGTDREPIPDAPAIYFLLPTEENISRIEKDFQGHTYDSYQLNFLAPLPRTMLESLAACAVAAGCESCVTRVFDMYTQFVSLEDTLFMSRNADRDALSYYALNSPDASDAQMERMVSDVVESLFCVCATSGTVPIIRCSRGHAAEMIAKQLDARLRDNLKSRASLFADPLTVSGSFQRPLLAVLDRGIDLAAPLHHTWTYQALTHDLLDYSMNRVKMAGDDKKPVVYDLDKTDVFWGQQRGRAFPEVAAAVEEALTAYKDRERRIKELKGGVGGETDDAVAAALAENTAMLNQAVSSLGDMVEQKKNIDMHMNLLTRIMEQLKDRQLDVFYEVEEEIMNKKTPSKPVLEILRQSGNPQDKLRMYLLYLLDAEPAPDTCAACEAALRDAGCDLGAIAWLRQIQQMQRMSHHTQITASHSGESLFSQASKMIKVGGDFWAQGIKKLVPTSGDLAVTRVVEALLDNRSTPMTQDYLYLDPRTLKAAASTTVPKGRAPFDEAMVYIVGGGTYNEYQNLQDFCQRTGGTRRITYGSTTMVSATQLLSDMTRLGTPRT